VKRTPLKRSRPRRNGDKVAAQKWWDAVQAKTGGRCWVNPNVAASDSHHVIEKQTLKRRNLDHAVWDPRNGIPLSRRVHERHSTAVERIPRSVLPAEAFEFAAEFGLMDVLERRYPEC
jgi:hypothetical protein